MLKPSEQDPTSSLFLAELALEAGLPPGVLNVVHGGPDIANGLCEHPDIKAVSFIGSTRVGTEIYNRASAAGKRCQSMMGAKNHCVVLPDADPDVALLLGAAFGAAGQRCMASSVAVLVGDARNWLPTSSSAPRSSRSIPAPTARPTWARWSRPTPGSASKA